jgi:preprotein translocase subunit YajC
MVRDLSTTELVMDALATLLPLLLIVGVFYLLLWRPMRQRNQEFARTQAALQPGVRVMMGGGLYATVLAVTDDDVTVEASPGVQLRYSRQGVVKVLDSAAADGPA